MSLTELGLRIAPHYQWWWNDEKNELESDWIELNSNWIEEKWDSNWCTRYWNLYTTWSFVTLLLEKKTALSDTDLKRHLSILHVSHQASHAIGSMVVEFSFLGRSSSFWSFRIPIWLMGVVFSSKWSGLIGPPVWLIPNLHPLKIIKHPQW
jgi:hypothetical protein